MKKTVIFLAVAVVMLVVAQPAQARYAGGMNLYGYVGGNPAASVDPFGLKVMDPFDSKKTNVAGNQYGDWQILQARVHRRKDGFPKYGSNTEIQFKPKGTKICCAEISFIQVVQLVEFKRGIEKFVLTGKQGNRAANGWIVDQDAVNPTPWYPYTKTGSIDPDRGVAGAANPKTKKYKVAAMRDGPGVTSVGNYVYKFETYAICKKGADKNKVYGGLRWGFAIVDRGTRNPPVTIQYLRPSHLNKPTLVLNQARTKSSFL